MARKSVISISSITEVFVDKKLFRKAENSVNSGHVSQLMYDDETSTIRGEVHASMKNRIYKVEVIIDEGTVSGCNCNCPRGLDLCHHMAALALFAHYNLSVTDKACMWSKPKTPAYSLAVTAEECFAESVKQYNPLAQEVSDGDVQELVDNLKLCTPTGLCWLLSPELSEKECDITADIQQLIFSSDFVTASNKRVFLQEKLKVSDDKITEVAEATIGQSANPLWLITRKHRLTASNFGRIIKACRRGKYPPSLFKTLTGSYNLDGVKQIQWGRMNEENAISALESIYSLTVQRTGIWLHECGYIGASPDGLVTKNAIVETKCPYKYKDKSLRECLSKDKDYILRYDSNQQKYILNKDNDYFYQIQGQLHILKRDFCYLVLWTLLYF